MIIALGAPLPPSPLLGLLRFVLLCLGSCLKILIYKSIHSASAVYTTRLSPFPPPPSSLRTQDTRHHHQGNTIACASSDSIASTPWSIILTTDRTRPRTIARTAAGVSPSTKQCIHVIIQTWYTHLSHQNIAYTSSHRGFACHALQDYQTGEQDLDNETASHDAPHEPITHNLLSNGACRAHVPVLTEQTIETPLQRLSGQHHHRFQC